uniref:Uncharacterized protein n=1 Tax=Glyptapanteles indiensis TaxID=92994 RepID=B7S962_GLYIN|nr:hypothetical protein GIP_L8_0510 [Glyptapanteles indiensis]
MFYFCDDNAANYQELSSKLVAHRLQVLSVRELFCDVTSLCIRRSIRGYCLQSLLRDSVRHLLVTNQHHLVVCYKSTIHDQSQEIVAKPVTEQCFVPFYEAKLLSSLYFDNANITSSVSLRSHIFSMNIYDYSTSKVCNVEIYKFILNKTMKTRHLTQSISKLISNERVNLQKKQ